MMKIQMLALIPLLAATLIAAQAEVPGSPLARAFAEWKLAAATTASGPESLAALRALREEVASRDGDETLNDLAGEIDARLAALAPMDAQDPAKPATKRAEELVVAEAVVTAVKTGDQVLLNQLGSRAVPALGSLAVNADGTTIPPGQLNPLEALFQVDVHAGLDAALVLMESGDVLKKGFAAATLEHNRKLNWSAAWEPVGDSDWEFVEPAWHRIVPTAFEEPALSTRNMSGSLDTLLARGRIPRDLEDRVFDELARIPRVHVVPESGRPFFVRLLRHPHVHVRERALLLLRATPDPEPTYVAATDPDAGIREILVDGLVTRQVTEYTDRYSGTTHQVVVPTEITDAYRAAVLQLCRDEVPNLRNQTVRNVTRNVLQQGKPLFSGAELREFLAGVTSLGSLYEAVEQVSLRPVEERVPTILWAMDRARELFGDDPSDQALRFLQNFDDYGLRTVSDFWAVVDGLSERGLLTPTLRRQIRYQASSWIEAGENGADRYVEWAARHGGTEGWAEPTKKHPATREVELAPWLREAGSRARATAVRALAIHHPTELNRLDDGRLALAAADLLDLVRDGSAESEARMWAGSELVIQHPDAVTPEALDALVEVWATAMRSRDLFGIGERLEPLGMRGAFLRGLIAAPHTNLGMLHGLSVDPNDAETVDAVLERFPPEAWEDLNRSDLVGSVVRGLVARAGETFDPRLEAANIRDHSLQADLAAAVGSSRAPALLPLLDRILANSTPGCTAWNYAVQSASGYFNDDAAALLLRAAREATTSDARQHAMNALEQMTDWREASAAWERSANAAAKREVAIAELVALIGDDAQPVEVRAEALRGLGLLDAAEELPRLVRALTSREAPIAAAARDALDRLNAR